jgi:hypothetical protein
MGQGLLERNFLSVWRISLDRSWFSLSESYVTLTKLGAECHYFVESNSILTSWQFAR